MRTTELVMRVADLDVAVGDRVLARHVRFDIAADGGALVIVGHNGAGKSTLLRLLRADLTPPPNAVRLFGRDVSRLAAHAMPRLGVTWCHQVPQIVPDLTVLENILLGEPIGHRRLVVSPRARNLVRRARGLMEAFGLPSEAEGLSAGQRRAIDLCRCFLAPCRRLYLFDEPTANLDDRGIGVLNEALCAAVMGRDMIDPDIRDSPSAAIIVEHQTQRIRIACEIMELKAFSHEE